MFYTILWIYLPSSISQSDVPVIFRAIPFRNCESIYFWNCLRILWYFFWDPKSLHQKSAPVAAVLVMVRPFLGRQGQSPTGSPSLVRLVPHLVIRHPPDFFQIRSVSTVHGRTCFVYHAHPIGDESVPQFWLRADPTENYPAVRPVVDVS